MKVARHRSRFDGRPGRPDNERDECAMRSKVCQRWCSSAAHFEKVYSRRCSMRPLNKSFRIISASLCGSPLSQVPLLWRVTKLANTHSDRAEHGTGEWGTIIEMIIIGNCCQIEPKRRSTRGAKMTRDRFNQRSPGSYSESDQLVGHCAHRQCTKRCATVLEMHSDQTMHRQANCPNRIDRRVKASSKVAV